MKVKVREVNLVFEGVGSDGQEIAGIQFTSDSGEIYLFIIPKESPDKVKLLDANGTVLNLSQGEVYSLAKELAGKTKTETAELLNEVAEKLADVVTKMTHRTIVGKSGRNVRRIF